jgi:hypothetical protein
MIVKRDRFAAVQTTFCLRGNSPPAAEPSDVAKIDISVHGGKWIVAIRLLSTGKAVFNHG